MKFRSLMTAICVLATANIVSAAPFAYVANSGTKNVSVIDTDTNLKVTDVALPDTNPVKDPYAYGVAVGASGQYVYVGLQETNQVAVIDTATNTVTKVIGLGSDQPGGLAVNTAETRLYIASNLSNTLIVIDISGGGASEVARVAVDDSSISNPEGVVLSPDGLKAYVANNFTGTIAEIAIDEVNNVYSRTALIPLVNNSKPMGLSISSDGAKLYAAAFFGTASMINTATRAVTDLVVNSGNYYLAMTPDNNKLYAPSAGFNNMYWINGANNAVTALGGQNSLFNSPWGSSVTPGGAKLYVAMNLSDNVKVFDTGTDLETASINLPAGAKPTSIGDFIGPVFTNTITSSDDNTKCYISPEGAISVNGYGRTFTSIALIPSDTCEVKVDGLSVGQPSAYSFSTVSADHTITSTPIPTGTYYTLDGNWISSVGGYLVSTDAGISQNSKSAKFLANSTVALQAGPSFQVQAGTWTGACTGTVGSTCSILMDGDKTFGTTAVVVLAPIGGSGPIWNVTQNTYHQTLVEATGAAATNDVIKISTDYTVGGSTTGNAGVQVKLSSQWKSSDYSWDPVYTTIGQLVITNVAVIADGLVI